MSNSIEVISVNGSHQTPSRETMVFVADYSNSQKWTRYYEIIRLLMLAGFCLLLCGPVIAQDSLSQARTLYNTILTPEPLPAVTVDPVAPEPMGTAVHFSTVTAEVPPEPVDERWLVSEPWCTYCPAAKARFLSSGGKEDHVITMAQARTLHNKSVSRIPHEYTYRSVTTTYRQPASYRSISRMTVTLDGSATPSHAAILRHLRHGGPHQSKRWQSWYLENWKLQQLYALHDDDHADSVPYESDPSFQLVADIASPPSTIAALYSFSELLKDHADPESVMSSWFEYDVNAPDILPSIIMALMKDKSYTNSDIGISLSWPGQQSFALTPTSITITPAIQVSVQKYGIKAKASVSEIKFGPDYQSVTVVTPELLVPDLTINFK